MCIRDRIITIDEDFQIIVITGRNQRLYEAFNRILYKNLQPKRKVNLHLSTKSKKFLMHHSLSDSRRRAKVKKPVQKPTKLLFFTSEVDKYMPVSYTHLDVYKRQALVARVFDFGQCVGMRSGTHTSFIGK